VAANSFKAEDSAGDREDVPATLDTSDDRDESDASVCERVAVLVSELRIRKLSRPFGRD
jgi:hypothetical protein